VHTCSFAVTQGNHQNLTHPCYIIIVDWFSWGWSTKFFFFDKKKLPTQKKNKDFQLSQFSFFILENFRDWSLGMYNKLMWRASMWLNLYGRPAVWRKLKKGQKIQKIHFNSKLSLRRTVWWPNRFSHINTLCINLLYLPKDQSLKFSRKKIENWGSWKSQFL
jgi:hypothetical protein